MPEPTSESPKRELDPAVGMMSADTNDASLGANSFLDPVHAPLPPRGLLRRQPWITVLLPFLIYMIFQAGLEGRMAQPDADAPAKASDVGTAEEQDAAEDPSAAPAKAPPRGKKDENEGKIPYKLYPRLYTWKLAATIVAMLLVLPGYWAFRCRPSLLGIAIGLAGGVIWIGLCKLHLEPKLLGPLGLGKFLDFGQRPGFNPLEELAADPAWARQFLAIRFLGLVIVVPIIEEFFLRGWLMRYVMHYDWPLIPFGMVDRTALIVGTAIPMLMHPGELLASAVWFSMVTWLMVRTKCIWSCIVAHSLTNLIIGLWVLWSGDWFLM